MLLEAYAHGTIAAVMLWGVIASFAGALLLLILTVLGIRHAKLTPEDRLRFDEHDGRMRADRLEPVA